MDDDDLIPISALQHYLYCPRQCALIHIERLWAENRHTAEGRLLHERADQPKLEKRRGVRTITAMPLAAPQLGIGGVADVVEFHKAAEGEIAYPVEYKRGSPKSHRADEVQLCAQALCLEVMLQQAVPEGALYYGQTRRRDVIVFDTELRELTLATIHAVQALFSARRTPMADYQAKRCDACSLIDLCQPKLLGQRRNVVAWLKQQLQE